MTVTNNIDGKWKKKKKTIQKSKHGPGKKGCRHRHGNLKARPIEKNVTPPCVHTLVYLRTARDVPAVTWPQTEQHMLLAHTTHTHTHTHTHTP